MAKKNSGKFLNGNENLPINEEYEWTPELIEEFKKCKDDVFYFAENYFYIVNVDEGKQKIKLYDAQRQAIDNIINNRFNIICASRQVGKSTLVTVVCLWYAMFKPNQNIAILANKETAAFEILDRIKLAYMDMPNWLKSAVKKFNETVVEFANQSKIFISTTSADSIRGKSINLLFLDEFAHLRKEIADEFYKSAIPTISSGKTTKIIIVSTPKGAIGKFYEIFSEAEKGKNGWIHSKIYWHQVPGRDAEWKRQQLSLINNDVTTWQQEYDIQFLEDGTSAVSGDMVEKLKQMCFNTPIMASFDNGEYKLWDEPKPNRIYVIGVDAAEGIGLDNSVAQIFDITDLSDIRQVGIFASNKLQPYIFAEKLNQIARSWGRPFLCIERNAQGGQVIDAMTEVHLYDPSAIVHYSMKNDTRQVYGNPGIFCHQNSKYTGIMNMKYYLEVFEAVKVFDIDTVKEFETFIRRENKTWGAKKGFKDDRIMSLIWALILLERDITEKYLEIIELDEQGKPLRIADPNQDFINQLLLEGIKKVSYARLGGSPQPTIFQFGGGISSYGELETAGYMESGFRFL